MGIRFLRLIIVLIFLGLIPIMTCAQATSSSQQVYIYHCVTDWMAGLKIADDKGNFQNVGTKYCTCLSSQAQDNASNISNPSKTCISHTLLHDVMDSLNDDLGFSDLTLGDVNEYCEDRWTLIYQDYSDSSINTADNYCACAKNRLLELAKKRDNISGEAYRDGIDKISSDCAGKIKAFDIKAQEPLS